MSTGNKEPRKRGRRPKASKGGSDAGGDEPRVKKERKEENNAIGGGNGQGGGGGGSQRTNHFHKPPIAQLKKTGESWLQDGFCWDLAPKLHKCRECRMTTNRTTNVPHNVFCRFYAFRRLRYTRNGQLAIAGFCDPNKDPLEVR